MDFEYIPAEKLLCSTCGRELSAQRATDRTYKDAKGDDAPAPQFYLACTHTLCPAQGLRYSLPLIYLEKEE